VAKEEKTLAKKEKGVVSGAQGVGATEAKLSYEFGDVTRGIVAAGRGLLFCI